MKKLFYLCLAILLCTSLFVTGCLKKTQIYGEEFVEAMDNKGYEVVDVISDIDSNTIKEAYIASKEDYYINFYVLENIEEAELLYDYYKDNYKIVSGMTTSESDMINYKKYIVKSDDKYMVISQIEYTLLYASAKAEQQEEIEELLVQIGY